uniref:PACT_coil_coil domain-containing protein n=1 Tax=Panagrellus redivivus TaxID=6233 RepID=A0A7E4W4K0_PANRE
MGTPTYKNHYAVTAIVPPLSPPKLPSSRPPPLPTPVSITALSSPLSISSRSSSAVYPPFRGRVSNGSNYDSQERRLVSLETQVQTLRDQLHETKGLLTETQSENDRLRYMFANPDPEELAKLRQCLTAAEADVIQRQNEMDILRRQYDPPVSASGDYRRPLSSVYSADVSRRLVSLLKVQVGALSKVLHSSQSSKFTVLRPSVDKLIRTVANLDENAEQAIDKMENAFADVVAAYERLSSLIDYRRKDQIEAGTMTDAVETAAVASSSTETADGFVDEDLIREIHVLEGELEDIQLVHSDEMESQKLDFERQLRALKERVEYEEASRRKLQEELQTLNSSNDQRIAAIKATYEDTIADLRSQFDIDLKKLRDEHQEELEDEKNATRLALDCVRRAHEEELVAATEKLRREHSTEMSNISPNGTGGSDKNAKQMLDQMAAEIKSLSTMYTAKCLENSQLDEKMQALLADKENQTEREEMELHNRRMQRDIRQKDATIDELRLRICELERRLSGRGSPEADSTDFNCSRRPIRRSLSRTPVLPKDYTFSYYANNNSTATGDQPRTPRSRSNRFGTSAGTEVGPNGRVPVDRLRSVSTGRHREPRTLEGRSVPAA